MLGKVETLNHRRRLKEIKQHESIYAVEKRVDSRFNSKFTKHLRRSIQHHSFIADTNPQQVYLRESIFKSKQPQAKKELRVLPKLEKFSSEKLKADNNVLFTKLCGILLRENSFSKHAKSQDLRLSGTSQNFKRREESRLIVEQNLRMLSLIQQAGSSIPKTIQTKKIRHKRTCTKLEEMAIQHKSWHKLSAPYLR